MAGHLPVTGVVKFRLNFTIGSNTNCSSHVYYHTSSSALATSDLSSAAAGMISEWTADLKAWHHASVILTSVEAEDLGNPGTIPGLAAGPVAGSRSGDTPFADVAVLVNMKIARRYRGGKPRLYLPLLNAGDLQDNAHWNSTILANLQTQVVKFLMTDNGGVTAGLDDPQLVNVGYIVAGSPASPPKWDAVSAVTCNPIPGSQRRRLGR